MFNFRPEKTRIVRANDRKIRLSNRINCFVVTLKIVLQNPNLHSASLFFTNFLGYSAVKTSSDMNYFRFLSFAAVPLRFHEFFVEIIENIVALKIMLQNPNLVQKTSSDVQKYFHLLNFAAFFVCLCIFTSFLGGDWKYCCLENLFNKIQICILLRLYTHKTSPDTENYFHFLSFAAHFCLCLCVFTSFLLREIIENSLCM